MEFLPIEKNGEKVYAGILERFGAAIVDLLFFIPFMVIFHFLESISLTIAMLTVILSSMLFSVYTIYFHYKFGATLGKMAMGIRVTLPNGASIGLKQALLRSSVDLGFAFITTIAQVIAISNAAPDQYLNSGWIERAELIMPLFPAWYGIVNVSSELWFWGEFIVLLFNKRKRAIHDFIAGTVVIHKEHAEQGAQRDAADAAPVS